MPDRNNRVLILFAHPSRDRSEANIPLFEASTGRPGVTVVDLYGEYPDYRIDIDREQERLREHDVIVFMFMDCLRAYTQTHHFGVWILRESACGEDSVELLSMF